MLIDHEASWNAIKLHFGEVLQQVRGLRPTDWVDAVLHSHTHAAGASPPPTLTCDDCGSHSVSLTGDKWHVGTKPRFLDMGDGWIECYRMTIAAVAVGHSTGFCKPSACGMSNKHPSCLDEWLSGPSVSQSFGGRTTNPLPDSYALLTLHPVIDTSHEIRGKGKSSSAKIVVSNVCWLVALSISVIAQTGVKGRSAKGRGKEREKVDIDR
ncbi:hypothetical protein EmuJ_000365500 [Echinococcus multilocularis]|uniref:Uncharacterized protein n=1 Tax=Echinococcus multilocularis TaxID=6211 RepID=A0A068Y2B9_ECHMU|nr:hypothetical protein EmuJ_000365500 [Echinococcus multilocularis]